MAYFFKLPKIDDLTIGQQAALNEPNAIAISGGPGTGKSVVSLWRHIRNYGTGSKISLLLTYTKTLEAYLSESTKSEAENANNETEKEKISVAALNVNRTLSWLFHGPTIYQEIIIDEAQDVPAIHYQNLKQFSESICYGADDGQIVFPKNPTTEKELGEIFKGHNSYLLDENFRNSYEIMRFLKAFFNNKLIYQYILEGLNNKGRNGPMPILVTSINDFQKQISAIEEIIKLFIFDSNDESNTHNIAILVPLKKDVESIHSSLINNKIHCSKYYEGIPFNGIYSIHVTTFKSAKGLEFDTVIIPDFGNYEWNIQNLTLAPITESDYYVAMTRAKRNLYLLCRSIPNFLERSENQKSTYSIEQI